MRQYIALLLSLVWVSATKIILTEKIVYIYFDRQRFFSIPMSLTSRPVPELYVFLLFWLKNDNHDNHNKFAKLLEIHTKVILKM